MIIRILNIAAIAALVSAALYAYSTKYETILQAEEIKKTKGRIQKEKDSIAVLRAEWQLRNQPDRLQTLATKHLSLQPLEIPQIASFAEIPMRPDKGDEIGRKLESLGVLEPTATPKDPGAGDARTPSARKP